MIACLFYSFRRHLDRFKLTAVYWAFVGTLTGSNSLRFIGCSKHVYNIIEQFKHDKYNRLVRLLVYY